MTDQLRFDDRVAIVTGAGGGLGRAHALLLASRGAAVVVNDLGGSHTGEGASNTPAQKVVDEIKAAGGEAVANFDSVEDGDKIVQTALDTYKRVDIIINNAGILRDVSFHKMTDQDWDLIYRVHVLGSYKVTHAAWPHMREQQFGRVIMTASAAGIYGNFGQANYSMAKLGLYGFANTLAREGQSKNIHVNTIAPVAGSRMTETVLPKDMVDALKPEYVSPLVAYLCHEDCPENGGLFEVGAGWIGKLRWERTKGVSLPLNREITPEAIHQKWDQISDYTDADHPADVQSSMGPAIQNLSSAKKPAAGNANIDPDKIIGKELTPQTNSYTERDLSLYALGIGMAHEGPKDEKELQYVYELSQGGQKAFPTYAVTFPFNTLAQLMNLDGLEFNPMMLLHGEQYVEVPRPLPTEATVTTKAKISHVYDKGKGALLIIDSVSSDKDGKELARNQSSIFIRGIGDFGGDRGPSEKKNIPPNRKPDAVVEEKTDPNQALIYRLSGDRNPLHADPSMAAMGGFDQPILHGLCTFGFATRHVLKAFGDNDPARFKSVGARFARHVFPGETLVTEMWKDNGKIIFQTKVKERDEVCLSHAAVELQEVGTASAKEPASEGTVSQQANPQVLAIFDEMTKRVDQRPELIEKVGAIYQFDVTGEGGGTWTVDLKNKPGKVHPGANGKPDCTIALGVDDFVALMTGQLDGQQAFMQGKLKISGNMMLATKLNMLQ